VSFLEQLSSGDLGVRFILPEGFVLQEETGEHLMASSREQGALLWVFSSEDPLDLNPAHQAVLRQDLEHAARDIFIMTSSQIPREKPLERLRTDDASWSPLIEVTPLSLNGNAALSVLHRTLYEPGNESIMGHILIPVRDGMIELRTMNVSRQTGYRESLVSMIKMKENPIQPGEGVEAHMRRIHSQRDFDDPALDAKFPEHPLSRARQLLLSLQAKLTVTHPPTTSPSEFISELMQCAFVPPPRYLPRGDSKARAQLVKMSIATTDGSSILTVLRIGPVSDLKDLVQKLSQRMPPSGSSKIELTPRATTEKSAEALLTFDRGDGFLGQTAIRAFEDEEGETWLLTIGTSQTDPSEGLFQDLDALVRSFRRLAAPQKKPWYQFWK
jgi:hypothetical protein